ncbi:MULTISPECIES: hypothetical protein [unclassified Variovorax]|uniref:hypothetical protein n=1 Tax=unclassified Variovorax TaxID=663243 RepID=UPI001319B3B6|nr:MULTISPECIES: hypothetical protein [unclassified Variovorax]VTU43005.1 hypothetical protein SRS16P1_00413 [Variovorax sp. SRS16]VTU43035.1 hypothetical protein E5P1_00411 [Variovorax sp. PBL-E5]VTU43521.1 hypothetical protein H6P1_00493 [Variovorax sp. PBL-H6]
MKSAQTISRFALRDKTTGQLVRYYVEDKKGAYASEPVAHFLACGQMDSELPVYEQPTARKLHRVLQSDTPSYNATYDSPGHGELEAATLEIVRRTVTEEVEAYAYTPPPPLRSRLQQDKPLLVLRRYAGNPNLDATARTFEVFNMPEGETLASMQARARNAEAFLVNDFRFVEMLAVFEVPEDYVPDLRGKDGFAAITRAVVEPTEQKVPEPVELCAYDENSPMPVSAAWPLREELWRPFVDKDVLVTFIAVVPLQTLVFPSPLEDYLVEAFDRQVDVSDAEFRAVGAQYDGWDDKFAGDVELQVTCRLISVDA